MRDRPGILPGAPAAEPTPDFGDQFLKRAYRDAAGALNYRLYVPADHERRDLALVLMLHGCTQNPEDFALGTQMNGLADEFGLIVAYPHQTRRANPSGCWNWFDQRHQRRGSGEPAKLAGLAQALAREFGVRKDRVFAAGLSAGGAMAEVLAATYPDVFDAVGIHSGLAYGSAVDVPSAFAAMKGTAAGHAGPQGANVGGRKIVFHGGADSTVHPINGERILDEAGRGPNPLKRADLDWGTEAGRVSRTVLEDAEGRPLSSAGWSRAAATPGSAATPAAPIRKASGWTPPGSWCAFSCGSEDKLLGSPPRNFHPAHGLSIGHCPRSAVHRVPLCNLRDGSPAGAPA